MDVATMVVALSATDQITELYASSAHISIDRGIFPLTYMTGLALLGARRIWLG
jgi:hypothetical protein